MPDDNYRGSSVGSKGTPKAIGAADPDADSGPRYASGAEVEDKKNRQAFDTSKGWSGIAGAARKPPKSEYERQYADYLKSKAKAAGQAKALEK